MQSGQEFDDETRLMLRERVKRVGELAGADGEILQHEYEPARDGIERRSVRLRQAGQLGRQLTVEARLGFGESAQLAHQARRGRLRRHLDEDRIRHAVAGECQPGP